MKFKLPSLLPAKPPSPPVVKQDEEGSQKGVDGQKSKLSLEDERLDTNSVGDNSSSKVDTSEFQQGVKNVQATNQVWSKTHLIIAYVLIWIIQFIMALSSGIINTLTPYVTSSFSEHSLTATTQIVSSMISGLIVLPYAKLINVWGRPQGFALMVLSMTVGLIMMAACQNVETYCAAEVFYQVGYSTVGFSMTVFIADTTSLRNRAFMIAFSASPWIITVWAFGPASQKILETIGFRWGFGIWAIVTPIVCAPLFGLFYYNLLKARKAGLVVEVDTGSTFKEKFKYYVNEFDVIGLLLIVTGLALFLLSFNLYAKQPEQWRSPLIISFVVIGGCLIIAFGFWEKLGATQTFIPWHLIKDRTIVSTYTMMASIYTAWYLWNSFFYSYLIVVNNVSITQATYITNIYTIGATFWSIVVGVIIRYNGRLKWLALYFGVPMTILGVGLMINFRQPDVNIGFIVMCQIFIAVGGGTLVICQQMTVMAIASHQYMPMVLSMENMIANVGGSIGSTIAGAMWIGIFPQKLAEYLPERALGSLQEIYGSIEVQSSYPIGSEERIAINRSYSDTQRLMLITATCLYSITFLSVIFWKDVDVKYLKKVKGLVF